jgi:nitrate/TMAO reductase-like tetraheme cytochrome c subunit
MSPLNVIEFLVAGMTALLAGLVAFRADLTRARGGKILAFIALFLLPALAMAAGLSQQMEKSKSTQFCMSCHVMEDYGKSLHVDDKSYIPAAHYQNNRVPRDQACYPCHSDYTMYGGLTAKIRGLRHVYIQYLGNIPKPEDIKLYTPFNNRECLHCHAGARSYMETSSHHKTPDMLQLAAENKLSCMSSRCHDTVHDVGTLVDAKFWTEKN